MRRVLAPFLAALAAAVLAGCAGQDQPAIEGAGSPSPGGTPAGVAVTGSISAADQTTDGMKVTVASVEIQGRNGFVAIHRDDGGRPGQVVGHSALIPQDTPERDVIVSLDERVVTGEYWAMLHQDSDGDGQYKFPPADPPVLEGNQVVMARFRLTVE